MEADQDEDFHRGDLVVEPCSDGLVHAFRFLDDGQADRPVCGSPAVPTGRDAGGGDVVCEPCIHLMAEALGCDMPRVRAVVDARKARA